MTLAHSAWVNALRAVEYRRGAATPARVREWLAVERTAQARARRKAMTVEDRRAEWLRSQHARRARLRAA